MTTRRVCPTCQRLIAINMVAQRFRSHHITPSGPYCEGSHVHIDLSIPVRERP